jgi:putative endonuclease
VRWKAGLSGPPTRQPPAPPSSFWKQNMAAAPLKKPCLLPKVHHPRPASACDSSSMKATLTARHRRPSRLVVWHVYLVECMDGSLYTGTTTDVARRYHQHLSGTGARYTKSHPPRCLIGSRGCGSQGDALREEARLRRLTPAARRAFFTGA